MKNKKDYPVGSVCTKNHSKLNYGQTVDIIARIGVGLIMVKVHGSRETFVVLNDWIKEWTPTPWLAGFSKN